MRIAVAAALAVVLVLFGTGAVLYQRNATPTVPVIGTTDAAAPGTPWVVKLHAQWCPVCILTKGTWSEIAREYAGRVRFVVFDFTDQASVAASRAEAERLGLGGVFEEAGVATGAVLVLDGRTKEITAWIDGSRDFAEYRAAIDAALATAP